MKDKTIYLDHNATTALKPLVRNLIEDNLDFCGNASSIHKIGREAKKKIEQAREEIAGLVNAPPRSSIVFTSGASEANNMLLKGCDCERIIISETEHSSVINSLENKELIAVDSNGIIKLDELSKKLESKNCPTLISVMMVNNETGVIQPIKKIVEIAKKHGALVHTDAVQAAGRIPIDIKNIGVDFLTLSSHKIGGPQGAGCLVISGCFPIKPLINGGGQEKNLRAGTENILSIMGFGKAASLAAESIDEYKKLAKLRNKIENTLKEINPDIKFWGEDSPRVANTTMFSVPKISGETQLIALDLEDIYISNGSACSSGTVKASHVLKAMGASDNQASSALRISLGWNSTEKDVEYFLDEWIDIYNRIKLRISA